MTVRRRVSVDKRVAKKTPGLCPLCGERVGRTSGGTRHLRHCEACGATLNKDFICPHCSTQRVWTGRLGAVCHGCGKRVIIPRNGNRA